MSTTNRAFIKAYRHDTAQPGGASGEPIIAAERVVRESPDPALNRVVRGSPDPAPLTTEGLQLRGARRPAVGVSAGSGDPRTTAAGDPVARSGDRPHPMGDRPHQATERRPLSSYISRTQPVEETGESPRADTFRPGTTVAAFQWPAVCRTLLQQSGPQLDHVIRILLTRARAGNSLIGVLGMFPRIGATTTALCLALRAAGHGRRVILADGNFVNPRVASLLDAVPTAGWEEALKHSAPLADAVIHATGENLHVLALGKRPIKDPQPLVGGLQAAVTAGVLRHAYDLVLLDLGTFFDPISQPITLELISNMGVDAAVAIAGPDSADRRDLATITEHLDRSGCELLGVIENRVAKPKAA